MDMYKFRVIGYDSVTKDKTTRMYRVDYAYKTPDGKLHRTCKRGFALKKDANAWAMSELPNLVAEKGQDKPLAPPAPVLPKTAKRTKQSIEDMFGFCSNNCDEAKQEEIVYENFIKFVSKYESEWMAV